MMIPMRDRIDQLYFAFRIFLCGLFFFVWSYFLPGAMSPEVYGVAATDIKAATWSLGYMSAAGLILYGVIINGRWRWSPILRLTGFFALLLMFIVLVVSSLSAPHGSVVAIFGGLFFIPEILYFIRANILDMVARR